MNVNANQNRPKMQAGNIQDPTCRRTSQACPNMHRLNVIAIIFSCTNYSIKQLTTDTHHSAEATDTYSHTYTRLNLSFQIKLDPYY